MHNQIRKTLVLSCLMLGSCGTAEREFDNPADPKAVGTRSSGGTPGGQTTAGGTDNPLCLLENCDPVTSGGSFNLNALKVIGDDCEIGPVEVLKNTTAGRLTLVYRAKYTSEGLYQVYARNINVAANGTMTLVGSDPVNLFPNTCFGNADGVTAFSITGYRSGSSTAKKYAYTDTDGVTDFTVSMTCYNTSLNATNTFVASSLSAGVDSTVSFLAADGALGYFRTENVYVKANGTTLNPNGSANAFVVPGNWSTTGGSQLGPITQIYGTDAAGGMYFRSTISVSNYFYYLSNTGAVSALAPAVYSSGLSALTLPNQSAGGLYHSIYGLLAEYYYLQLNGLNNKNIVASGTSAYCYGGSRAVIGMFNDKLLAICGDSGSTIRGLYSYAFNTGKFSRVIDHNNSGAVSPYGRWNNRGLWYQNRHLYLTQDFY